MPDFIDLYPKLCFGHTKVPSNSVMCLVSARATLSSHLRGRLPPRYSLRARTVCACWACEILYSSRLSPRSAERAPGTGAAYATLTAGRAARVPPSPRGTAPVLVPRAGPPTGSPGLLLPSAKLHNSSSSDSNPALFLRAVRAARKSSSPTLRALITSSAACPELDVPPCSVTTAP